MDGMYGSMELVLQKFKNAYLVPTSAITTAGSKTYLLQVKNGVVHRVPVRVQLEDGVQAKVAVLVHEANIATGEDEVLEELTGEEEIVRSGQGEVADGQDVRPMLVDW